MIATVAEALEHAHQQRLIHRDIKPANILIEESTSRPYVADFGLAIREEDYLRDPRLAGTPAYMSPEQARSEGHRLDGRSDIFSLGVVLYELLTGKRPFLGSTAHESLHLVITAEPVPPREHDALIPAELERICLKALSKRASDRYSSGAEMAEDLVYWRQGPQQETKQVRIVPRGLRSFDVHDADFFLELLPGPRDRNGLPDSIRFWKSRIEESDPDKTFPVGLIYGPSGCGKSSLMKAGLLPRLSDDVIPIYVESTPDETEIRVIRGLKKRVPNLPDELGLVDCFSWLRQHENKRVVVVLDQFEQWLNAHRHDLETELVNALRQCDGGQVQAIAMVRDDFAMAAVRFMDVLDIPIVQGHNFSAVDLFDEQHARQVLCKFGQAFGKLPAQVGHLSDDENQFLSSVAAGLAEDGKVVSVRLALFAEMVKTKKWIPTTLAEVGGTQGIGVNFLEETFSSRAANPMHRIHEPAAREVLKALLPESGTNIKGHMRSHAELAVSAGYEERSASFNDLLRILDGELRLITPTDPQGPQTQSDNGDLSTKYFQLTHDYLVPSLREWLTRRQRETRRGRAELRLEERAALWNAKPENRRLPSLAEWVSIRCWTNKKQWTKPQQKLMGKATTVHGLRLGALAAVVVVLALAGIGQANLSNERKNEAEASRLVEGLLKADISQVASIIEDLDSYRSWADDELVSSFGSVADDSNAKLHAAMALVSQDKSALDFLGERLLSVSPEQFQHVRDILESDKGELIPDYWALALDGQQEASRRFKAACALATYDPESQRWHDAELRRFLAHHLVSVLPSELLPWRNALSGVRHHLVDQLTEIYRDQTQGERARSFATDTLADFVRDDPARLVDLAIEPNTQGFGTLFPVLEQCGSASLTRASERAK